MPVKKQENILIKCKISLLAQTPILLQQNICWTETRAYVLCLMQIICYTNYLYISIKSNMSHAFHFAKCAQQISQIHKAQSSCAQYKDANSIPECLSAQLEILLTIQIPENSRHSLNNRSGRKRSAACGIHSQY